MLSYLLQIVELVRQQFYETQSFVNETIDAQCPVTLQLEHLLS
jgi:hypothetical protein